MVTDADDGCMHRNRSEVLLPDTVQSNNMFCSYTLRCRFWLQLPGVSLAPCASGAFPMAPEAGSKSVGLIVLA